MCGAPADAATSRSPVASTTTRPRIAWRPLFVSQTTPVMRPSSTSACENHECRRSSIRCCATISSATRLKPSGSKAAAKTIGCGLSWLVKSNAPQRVQRCSAAGWRPHSSWRGNAARSRAASRSISSRQTPRTEISCSCASNMSSSTSTMPPEARPPRWL